MLELLTYVSFFGIFYAYFGYAFVLMTILAFRGARPIIIRDESDDRPPKITVIIAVYNEEKVIRSKLLNTIAALEPLKAMHEVQIIVASDESSDGTDAIVKEFSAQGVELVRSDGRHGKENAQRLGLAQARGDIIVFTDAKVEIDKDAISKFLPYFSDHTIGVVSSFDSVDGGSGGEGAYVRYEMWLRGMESKYHTLVGLSGSCFAMRRKLTEDWRVDLPSDFYALIKCQKVGLRGVLAENVICRYTTVASTGAEFHRKVRTVLRGISTLMAAKEVMNFKKYGTFAWQIVSHKLCRWLVPWFFIFGTIAAFILADSSAICFLLAFGALAVLVLAFVAFFILPNSPSLALRIPLFFITSNLAIVIAWVRYFLGERTVTWQPSRKQ